MVTVSIVRHYGIVNQKKKNKGPLPDKTLRISSEKVWYLQIRIRNTSLFKGTWQWGGFSRVFAEIGSS